MVLSLGLYRRILIFCHFTCLHKIDSRYYETHLSSLFPVNILDSPYIPHDKCFHMLLFVRLFHWPVWKGYSQNSRQQRRTNWYSIQFLILATPFLLWFCTTLVFNITFLCSWLIWSLPSTYKPFIFGLVLSHIFPLSHCSVYLFF